MLQKGQVFICYFRLHTALYGHLELSRVFLIFLENMMQQPIPEKCYKFFCRLGFIHIGDLLEL